MFAAEWYETLLTTAGNVATKYMEVQQAKVTAETQIAAAKKAAKIAAAGVPVGTQAPIGLGGINLTTVMLLGGGALLVMLLLKRK